ncbi:cell adhesion molecule Dscam1-like isoform X1 [Amblyomma americanum]
MRPPPRSGFSASAGRTAFLALTTVLALSRAAPHQDRPVIQPFVLPSDVVTGVNTKLFCNVQSGTRPLSFAWIKDGAPVRKGISSQDDFSALSIDPVTAESAGNYTCVVSNAAGTDRYTSTLEVKQPSEWIDEPQDVSAAEGSEVHLRCSAAGRPPPAVTWSRCVSGGKRSVVCGDSEAPVPVRSSNGSVVFAHVTKADEGRYACFVDNGVGKPLRKVIRVAVNVPAKFSEKHSVVTARRGENARLVCDAQGDQPLTVAWSKGATKIDRGGSSRLEIFETMTESGLRSELFISSTERSDGAVYTCRAENEFGRDERTSKLLVVEVPGQPQDVKVSETWSRSASVSWSPPYSGNSPVSKYVIQYWKDSGTAHRLQEMAVPGSQTSALVGDLHPGSTYHLSILAENSVGVGLASTPVKLHTGEEEPSAPPTDFHVEARGPSTVRVSWKPPPPDEWNGDLLGYYIGYKPTSSGQPYSYRTSEFRPNASHEFFLTGLQRGTEYAVIAKAYNAAGSGVPSHELHVKTLDGDVPPPPKVFVSGTTHSSITVTWHQQFSSGVRGFVLHHRPEESSQDWKEVNLDSRTSSYTLSGLESGVLYQLYVSATNEYGTGDPSEIITVRTHKAGGVVQSPIFGDASTPLYLNLFIMIPVLASLVTIVLVVIVTCVCLQRIKRRPPQPPHPMQPPPGTMERRSKQFAAAGLDGQPQMTSTSARHAEKAQQAAGEYTGLSQRYVEVQPPPLPADHPCALYPAPCATLPMTEELEAKMARHNVNQEMKTFLAQNRELPTLPIGAKAGMSIKKDHMYESAQ